MLKGKKVVLTAIELEDLKDLLDWRNNPEFRKHFREYRELNKTMQEEWFREKVIKDPGCLMFAIRSLKDGSLLGCCGLVYINWVHRHADLSLYIGWENSYIDDQGFAEESCRLLFDYSFKELGLNKIWTEIYSFDTKKRSLYDKLKFRQDGQLRENYFYDGKWWDSLILSILAKDFL